MNPQTTDPDVVKLSFNEQRVNLHANLNTATIILAILIYLALSFTSDIKWQILIYTLLYSVLITSIIHLFLAAKYSLLVSQEPDIDNAKKQRWQKESLNWKRVAYSASIVVVITLVLVIHHLTTAPEKVMIFPWH